MISSKRYVIHGSEESQSSLTGLSAGVTVPSRLYVGLSSLLLYICKIHINDY